MTEYLTTIPYVKRIRPLFLVHFLRTFCSVSLKVILLLAALEAGGLTGFFPPLLAGAVFLPWFLAMIPAGTCSDRMPKRSVMQLAQLTEAILMIAGCVCYVRFDASRAADLSVSWPILCVLFLLSWQAAYFAPAFQGILPELFLERNLSRASGDLALAETAGRLLSLAAAPFLPFLGTAFCNWFDNRYTGLSGVLSPELLTGIFLAVLSVAALFLTFQIAPTAAVGARTNRVNKTKRLVIFKQGIRDLFSRKYVICSMLGGLVISFLIGTLPFLGKAIAGNTPFQGQTRLDLLLLLFLPAAAAGIGACFSGKRAKDKIELGYVSIGGIAAGLFLILAGVFAGDYRFCAGGSLHPEALVFLTLAGFFLGFSAVPLKAYLLNELKNTSLGSALAVTTLLEWILWGMIPLLSMLAQESDSIQIGSFLLWTGTGVILCLAVATLLMPWLFIRLFVLVMTHTFYKLRILGTEHIPPRGGVLFVSNHVSYIDSILILACTSRRIRFLMAEQFYRKFWIYPLARLTGVIPVPAGGAHKLESMFSAIREALKNGDAVCVFPEGRISENGITGDFKAGYAMMLPEGMDISIVPVNIGLVWGSMFTKYYDKFVLKLTSAIPYPATVSFGTPMKPDDADTAFHLRQAVEELNADAEIRYPRDSERPLHYQLAKNAKRYPFQKVVIDQDGKSLSLFKILLGGIIMSRTIRDMIPEETKYVGVYLPNTPAATVTLLGIMMADKVGSPLNFSVSRETLQLSIRKAGITHVLTSRLFLAKLRMEPLPEMVFLEDVAKTIPKYRKIFWTLAAAILPHQELMNIISPVTHNDVSATAVLLFSSGSTGIPKGIMLTHHNVNSDTNSLSRVLRLSAKTDRVVGSLPMFHSFGFTTCFWIPLMLRMPVVYIHSPLDSAMVGKMMEKYKLTVLLGTPTFMQSYMRKCTSEQFASLRLAIVGAEKLRNDVAERFREMTGNRTALIEGYGCTELSPIAAINVSRGTADIGKEVGKTGSIGVPMQGMCIQIVDPVTRDPLPPGEDGLMMVKGANVMKGYLNDPVQTASVLKNGWYDTGDIASMDSDGYVTISGRISRFSKIAGEMVPHELLECMMNEILGIEERVLAVGSIPDKAKGEALAVLVAKGKSPLTPEELTEKLREKGIPNLWIPRVQNYRETDEFPLMGNGKLDLLKLREIIKKTFEV